MNEETFPEDAGQSVADDDLGAPDIRVIGTPEARAKLWAAMGKARAAFDVVAKDLTGQTGQQKFKYANFAMISGAMVKPLAENGLMILQTITTPKPNVGCVTTLLAGHGAELWVEIKFATADNEHGFQATIKDFGAATTYYKRYQLQAIGFIEGDRDPDEGSDMRGPARADAPPNGKAKPAVLPDQQMRQIRELGADLGLSKAAGNAIMQKAIGAVKAPEFLTKDEADRFIAALKDEKAGRAPA